MAEELGLTPGVGLGEGFHAEINGLWTAGDMELVPTRGVSTTGMCSDCSSQISEMAERGGFELQLSSDGKSFQFVPH